LNKAQWSVESILLQSFGWSLDEPPGDVPAGTHCVMSGESISLGYAVRDVWAYIIQNEVRYNAAYDRMTELGIPRERQRIGPFANARALPHGQLDILRRGWPDEFARFAKRFPEAWEEQ
jgi:hypothetical protein